MSLFYNLLKTYENIKSITHINQADAKDIIDQSKTLLPLFHTSLKTSFCVTLNIKGELVDISMDKDALNIIIPCTEKSESRTRGIAAHPLCDGLKYLDKSIDPERFEDYISQLEKWKGDNIKLNAIYKFLSQNSLAAAIVQKGFEKTTKTDNKDELKSDVLGYGVRFIVKVPFDYSDKATDVLGGVWEDKKLQELWIDYVIKNSKKATTGFDYLSGKTLNIVAESHPRKINSSESKAKLISSNDKTNFTFRGKFVNPDDAVLIDAINTQKAHACLKWLVANCSLITGSQSIIVWAESQMPTVEVMPFDGSMEIAKKLEDDQTKPLTESDMLLNVKYEVEKDYSDTVRQCILGKKNVDKLEEHEKSINIAILEAATSGRMGVSYYRLLQKGEYLETIINWHQAHSWYQIYTQKYTDGIKEHTKIVRYIGCPSFEGIINVILRKPLSKDNDNYIILKRKAMKMLIECMFGNLPLPKSYIDSALARASNPMGFTNNKGSFDELAWENALDITCSMIKGYIYKLKKEEISMALDTKSTNRDYLYGRLLAHAHKIERDIQDREREEKKKNGEKYAPPRCTNAIRLMSAFSKKPCSTWGYLWEKVLPYLTESHYLDNQFDKLGEVLDLFDINEFSSENKDKDKPLSILYLMGFSAQRMALYQKKEEKKDEPITE